MSMRKIITGCSGLSSEKRSLARDSLVCGLASPERQASPGIYSSFGSWRDKRWPCNSARHFPEDRRLYGLVGISRQTHLPRSESQPEQRPQGWSSRDPLQRRGRAMLLPGSEVCQPVSEPEQSNRHLLLSGCALSPWTNLLLRALKSVSLFITPFS